MRLNEFLAITEDGHIDTVECESQPTTDEIAMWTSPQERWIIQIVSGRYEVYDRKTLRNQMGTYSIGLPKFAADDLDAAVMWALLQS